jgi:hypothetical protein
MSTLNAWDRLPADMREPLRRYIELLHELAGGEVEGLTVYGAAADGTFAPGVGLVRSVLVLRQVDLNLLRRIAERGGVLAREGIAAPIVMTGAYIRASLDTFALEFIEIQQAHVTLEGPDLFEDLAFRDEDVRLQCERELKVLLIRMRQGLLASGGRDEFIGELERDIGEGLVRTMRGMLWRRGAREHRSTPQVIAELEKRTGTTLAGVRAASTPSADRGWEDYLSLYGDIARLGEIADAG